MHLNIWMSSNADAVARWEEGKTLRNNHIQPKTHVSVVEFWKLHLPAMSPKVFRRIEPNYIGFDGWMSSGSVGLQVVGCSDNPLAQQKFSVSGCCRSKCDERLLLQRLVCVCIISAENRQRSSLCKDEFCVNRRTFSYVFNPHIHVPPPLRTHILASLNSTNDGSNNNQIIHICPPRCRWNSSHVLSSQRDNIPRKCTPHPPPSPGLICGTFY